MDIKSLTLLLLLFCVPLVTSMPESIGVGNYDEYYILAWNNGTKANETYLNRSSGILQHANMISRVNDVTYVFGYARNVSGTFQYSGITSIPINIKNSTDFTNYYWIRSEINISNHFMTKNYSQLLNDDYVRIDFVYNSRSAILGNSFFATGLRNMDVGSDGISDSILFLTGDGKVEGWDNRSGTFTIGNITRIVITGGSPVYNYDLKFPKGVIAIYNHTSKSTNGDFTFLDYIGVVSAGVDYNFSYYWIDVACTYICPANCDIFVYTNMTDIDVSQPKIVYTNACWWNNTGSGCTASSYCNLTFGSCSLTWVQETNGGGVTNKLIATTEKDEPIQCASGACFNVNPIRGTRYTKNLRASEIGETDYNCDLADTTGNGGYQNLFTDLRTWTTLNSTLNLTWWSPANNTLISFPRNWINYSYNWTNITCDNISHYNMNVSMTITNGSSSGSGNFTQNISIDYEKFGIYIYGGKCCYSHNCQWSWNGIPRISYQPPFIQLVNPVNNTNLSSSGLNWSILNATYNGSSYVNFSLLVLANSSTFSNSSVTYTDSSFPGNISSNTSFLGCGWWSWNVQACLTPGNFCIRSINGTMNITKECPYTITPTFIIYKLKYYFIDKIFMR